MQMLHKEFVLANLEEKGRLQFFFHSPSSELPVRDVLNGQGRGYKTEPHIEIDAENFINLCYQKNNIIPFLKSREKYLFLFTTCKSMNLKDYLNRRFIVGYIIKQKIIDCGDHYAVQGETKLYAFEDAYPLEILFPSTYKNMRIKKLSKEETRKVLNHLKTKRNILLECIDEIKRLDRKNLTCKGENCEFRKECLRFR